MSVKQLVQTAKDKPGTLRVATVPGSMWDYLIEQVETNTGAKVLRVPFQGGGAGINALAGGNVDIAQGFYSRIPRPCRGRQGGATWGRVLATHELPKRHADDERGTGRKRVSMECHTVCGSFPRERP